MRDRRPHPSLAPPAIGLVVLAATQLGALTGFYLTLIALAGLIGVCFRGYLRALDGAGPGAVVETIACAVAAALVLGSCALRFPDIISGTVPAAARQLDVTAFAVTVAAGLTPLALIPLRAATAGVRRRIARRAADRRLAQRLRRPADVF